MEHENLISKLDRVMKELESLRGENPTGSETSEKERNARIDQLIEEGVNIAVELDAMIRLGLRNNPQKLAEWKTHVKNAGAHLQVLK